LKLPSGPFTPLQNVVISDRNACPIPPTQSNRSDVSVSLSFGRFYRRHYNFIQGWDRPVKTKGNWSTTFQIPSAGIHPGTGYGGSNANLTGPIDIIPGTYYFSAECIVAGASTSYDNYNVVFVRVNASSSAAVAPIARSLGTPAQIFSNVPHDVANAAITVGAILFITFPASIFNSTFAAHYDEILLLVGRWRRRLRRLRHPFKRPAVELGTGSDAGALVPVADANRPGAVSRPTFFGVLLIGAVLGGMLNTKFGLNKSTATGLVATLCAFAFGAMVSWYITKRFRRYHQYGATAYRKALPLGLVIAAMCVLLSRLTGFEPGYLYGIVISFAFVETIEERHNAHLTAISTVTTLLVALLAWFLWLPVNHFATHHLSNVMVGVVDDVLGSIFVGGLVGSVVSLLPLALMPGHTLLKWRRDAWAAIFFISAFLMISVELRPAAGPTHPGTAGWVTPLVLFFVFGGATFLMRWFFARRQRQLALAASSKAN
jgi:hypothetical protein